VRDQNTFGNVWVVIAAYNEAGVLARVIADVTRHGFHIAVVDDGSIDATHSVARAHGAVAIRHPVNLGQGAALQTGIAFALSKEADAVVTFDADGQHRASDIDVLLAALERESAEFALGSRFLGRLARIPAAGIPATKASATRASATRMPATRRLLLLAATLFTRLTTGMRLTDTHNGLRAMTRLGAGRIHMRQNRMAHASEILRQIADSGLNYVEVPVTIEYTAYSLAKGQRIGDSLTILFDLISEKLYR
jgi:polyprenyl-phospho-N-acetylgalactosaminyl synthase